MRKEKMKKRAGVSLIEILIALGVLGAVVPASLGAFGAIFSAELRIYGRVDKASYADWWFSQLDFPVREADLLSGAPRRHGAMSFAWETGAGAHNALRITLRVTNGASDPAPFVESRVY